MARSENERVIKNGRSKTRLPDDPRESYVPRNLEPSLLGKGRKPSNPTVKHAEISVDVVSDKIETPKFLG